MYIKLTNGQPEIYTIGQLRRDNLNVSFPRDIPDSVLAEYDVYPLTRLPAPEYAPTHESVLREPELVNGAWIQGWDTVPVSEEVWAERLASEWDSIREERNFYLTECDWTQLPDAPVDSNVWATYRQALRDITVQTDPFNITWPTKP